jgi:quercetin dioxygenase-like cupin family protein
LFPSQSGTLFTYAEIDPGFGVDEPGWHATDTIDYVVVLKGEVYFLLDEEQVLLKAGDMLVIRGIRHAWVNRSIEPCILGGAMIGSSPLA